VIRLPPAGSQGHAVVGFPTALVATVTRDDPDRPGSRARDAASARGEATTDAR